MNVWTALRDRAFRWIADDPDPDSRAELQDVLARTMAGDTAATDELADRMAGPLTFGTAGLRGPVRAGPNGMNVAVVTRTTAGVAAWLEGHGHGGGIVVIGRDARHGSDAFATAAAEVLTGAGFDARVLPRPLPTPVLAFTVGQLGAVAGIQITASHNPPADNGYKLYDDTGRQIVPPADGEIEAAIEAAPGAVAVPTAPGARQLAEDELDAYLDRVAALPAGQKRDLRVVATALHGVGAPVLIEAARRAGFTDVHLVSSQAQPDPDFPTVPFPNPEEQGASDALLALAAELDADLAIALDPDADRCAIGAPEPDGTWRMLHGDETGVLLGDYLLSTTDSQDPLVATTIVSSSMLGDIARSRGARYAETLTGFKWLTRSGDGLIYAYEEALGLCVNPDFVRDKDGIAAAITACDLAAGLKASGRTVTGELDALAVRYGVHRTGQFVVRVSRLAEMAELMRALRASPPISLAGTAVGTEDLLPETDAVRLAGDGVRVVVRPSGTEPKLKAYLEVRRRVPDPAELASARARTDERLTRLRTDVAALLDG